MEPPLKKFYTFEEEFKIPLTKDYCVNEIQNILKTYSRETLIRFLSQITQELGSINNPTKIKEIQRKHLNIPLTKDVYVFHRQAILTLFQFIFSIPEEEYTNKYQIANKDIFILFIITNSYLGFFEYVDKSTSNRKKIFFTSIKTTHLMMNENDLQASFYFFDEYAAKIDSENNTHFDNLVKNALGEDIATIRKIFQEVKQQNYPGIFNFFDKFLVMQYEDIDKYWQNREPKFEIPFEYNFLNKFPLIKKNADYLVTDIFNLFYSFFTIIYEILVEDDREGFKGLFGKEIAEPVIIEFIKEAFKDNRISFLKVGSRSKEYGDLGILYENNIFLLEIKTSIFSRKKLFSTDYNDFIKSFNNKFVTKEGICQQVSRLIDIDNNYEHFTSLAELDKTKKFRIYPILLVFDEALQAFCTNWYLSTRFDNMKRVKHLDPSNYDLARNHSTITFNEIYRLHQLNITPIEKLLLIKEYSDSIEKQPMSFSIYIQEYHPSLISN